MRCTSSGRLLARDAPVTANSTTQSRVLYGNVTRFLCGALRLERHARGQLVREASDSHRDGGELDASGGSGSGTRETGPRGVGQSP